MWIPDKSPGGTMVYRGIYDKNWYLHPKECVLYREIRQRDNQFPLMQFTGLHDSAGNEIYEGDILTINFSFQFTHGAMIVIYKLGSFGYELYDDDGDSCFCALNKENFQIIGNVYQNTELLESKNV